MNGCIINEWKVGFILLYVNFFCFFGVYFLEYYDFIINYKIKKKFFKMIKRIVIMVIGWCYVGNFCCYSFNFFYKVVVYLW